MLSFLWDNLYRHNRSDKSVASLLKDNILFQDLSARQLKFVSNIVHLRRYQPNEIIFREDEVGVGMYIIVTGSVEIALDQGRSQGEDNGDRVIITKLGPGDFFGELALVEENGRRSATAMANAETELIGFFKPDLIDILARNPAVGVKISMRLGEVIGCRLKETTRRLSAIEEQRNDSQAG
jgi:CRP-like cAMP-binding protein